jgi:hypothetical protein
MKAAAKHLEIVNSAARAANEIRDGLESLRQRIAALTAERETTEGSLIPKQEAMARLDTWSARLRSGGVEHVDLASFTLPADPTLFGHPGAGIELTNHHILGSLLADALRDRLAARIEAEYQRHASATDAERGRKLDKLDAELLDLGLAEESMIRAAEAAGIEVLRRHDADPRCVLASAASLPQ